MKPVSYSGIQMYNRCPASFEYKYVKGEAGAARPTREEAPAMHRGTDFHQYIEDYLTAKVIDIHSELSFYAEFLSTIREQPTLRCEQPWAFNLDWEAAEWDECDIRGVWDAVLQDGDVVHVYEWKTGKRYGDHADQRALYGLAALLAYPMAKEALVTTVYLDQRENVQSVFDREAMTGYKWLWGKRIQRTHPPQEYPKKPSWACNRCSFAKDKGGPCPFG